jgi:hypothetical protein
MHFVYDVFDYAARLLFMLVVVNPDFLGCTMIEQMAIWTVSNIM